MANWSGLTLTRKGELLHAKVEINLCKLHLTKIKLGSGVLEDGQQLETLTDLIRPRQTVGIGSVIDNKDGTVTVEGIITNTDLETGYTVTEMGLFANDPDDGEILYAITRDAHPDYLPAKGGATIVSQEFNLSIGITNAANVTATIHMGSLATIEHIQKLIKMLQEHNTSTAAHADIRLLVENAGINLLRRNRAYAVGDIAYSKNLPSWARLECVKAGTTAADEPVAIASVSTGGGLVSDGGVLWIVDDVRDGTAVGSVRGSLYLPPGYVKANGATVQRADYPRIVALIDKHNLWTDDTAANAGLFGRGDGAATFVLPNWVDRMVQLAGDGIGASVAAGLPNITGDIYSRGPNVGRECGVSPGSGTGAFALDGKEVHSPMSNAGLESHAGRKIQLDASQSNPIYGASATVQPPAIKLIPIIRY